MENADKFNISQVMEISANQHPTFEVNCDSQWVTHQTSNAIFPGQDQMVKLGAFTKIEQEETLESTENYGLPMIVDIQGSAFNHTPLTSTNSGIKNTEGTTSIGKHKSLEYPFCSSPMFRYLKSDSRAAKAIRAINSMGLLGTKNNASAGKDFGFTKDDPKTTGERGYIVPSNKGGLKYIYKGYDYTMKKSTKVCLYWICACRMRSQCQGSMRTSHNLDEAKILRPHVHEPGSTEPLKSLSPAMDTAVLPSNNTATTSLDSKYHIRPVSESQTKTTEATVATNSLPLKAAKNTLLKGAAIAVRPCSTEASQWNYQTLAVSIPEPYVAHVELNRPDKGNAMNLTFWREMVACFKSLGSDSNVRAIVVSGRGKLFTGGLDLVSMTQEMPDFFDSSKEIARRARGLHNVIQEFQQSFTQIEQCPQPVIAAIHSACVGGGVDLTTACDVRFCSKDAYFQVKEVDLGLAADVGTLQRLPKIVGNASFVKDICYTARKVHSQEALDMGIVSRVLADKQSCIEAALSTARLIAEKSPVAVQTTKESLNYSRDHPVSDSLNHVRLLNQCMLQSEDVLKAAQAMMSKEKAVYSKL